MVNRVAFLVLSASLCYSTCALSKPMAIATSKLPPLVAGWPVIGNALDLAAEPIQFWVEAARKYGTAYRVRYPTAPTGEITVLAGLEANRLASRQGHLFSNRQYFSSLAAEAGTDNYIAAMDGADHAHFRKAMKPVLSREAISPVVPDLIRMVEQEVATWGEGEAIPVMDRLQRATVNGLAFAAGGCPLGETEYRHLRRFSRFFIGATAGGWPSFLLKMPFYKKTKHAVHEFFKKLFTDHERQQPGVHRRVDMLDMVLQATYPDGRPLNDVDRIANGHLPYVNGMTYTGRVTGFLLHELLHRPDLISRLTNEIDAAYANGTPTMRELREMTTLQNCVKEIFRHRPIAPAVPRFVVETFEFDGYTIPAGSFVFFAISVPHFDPHYFADPMKFDPDRYLPPRSEAMRANAYSPFGLGTHACLSIGLVQTITMITTLAVLRTVKLELHPKDYKLRVVLTPMPGPANLKVRVVAKRQHHAPVSGKSKDEERTLSSLGLTGSELKNLLAGVVQRSFEEGSMILREGDAADAFYVIMEGEVEVWRQTPQVVSEKLATLGPGSYFGEIGLLYGVPRTASIRAAKGGARVLEIGRDLFTQLVADHDLVSDDIAEIARRRVMVNQLAGVLPGLGQNALAKVSRHLRRESFAPGDVVIRQGDAAETFYVVVSGAAEVVQRVAEEDFVLAELGAGDYFGEIGILQNRPRTATVRAIRELDVLVLDRDHFKAIAGSDQHTGQAIAEMAVQRLLSIRNSASA